ncbi:MAG: M48 family metallopeptidase [Neisseria sp.]|nr:M48 family metallopeptidase [Neisseria sp.]
MQKILGAFLLSLGLLQLPACTAVADMAGYDSQTLNRQAEKNYMQAVREARSKGLVDNSSPTARRILAVFQRMKPYAEQANRTGIPFQWQMTVIKSDELNAWAMPGGKMAFYTGLAEQLKLSDSEIAAIIGHEMTHALHEHGKRDVGQKVLTGLAVELGGRAVQGYTGWSADTVGLAAGILGEYGVDKPFSRSQEYEADAGGLMLMAQAGYHPEAALSVWQKMNQHADNNSILHTILSTHPANNDRLQAMRKLMPKALETYRQSLIK